MIVDDLNVKGIAVFPDEADAPLVVDPDAVLPHTIPAEPLETVARRDPEILKRFDRMEEDELPQCCPNNLRGEPPGPLAEKHALGLRVAKAPNHLRMITPHGNNVNRYAPPEYSLRLSECFGSGSRWVG